MVGQRSRHPSPVPDDIRQRMAKLARARPRHGEHEMQRDPQRLRAVDVRKAGRVRDDGLGHKGAAGQGVGRDTRAPAALEHLGHHPPLLLDVTGAQALHARDEPRVLHHVRHQVRGIAADGEELQPRRAHKVTEDAMRSDSHPVAVAEELAAEGDKGLDIAAASNHLDDDVEADGSPILLSVVWRVLRFPF